MIESKTQQIATQGRPVRQIVSEAEERASILGEIVEKRKLYQVIGGNRHLQFEAWQTVGKFYGVFAKVEWTRLNEDNSGFVARAIVVNEDGVEVSAAEAECSRDEPNWEGKPNFQVRSMAQTRACSKALRNVLSWVVVLAGFQPTPAEEMTTTGEETAHPFCSVHNVRTYRRTGKDEAVWYSHKTADGKWCNAPPSEPAQGAPEADEGRTPTAEEPAEKPTVAPDVPTETSPVEKPTRSRGRSVTAPPEAAQPEKVQEAPGWTEFWKRAFALVGTEKGFIPQALGMTPEEWVKGGKTLAEALAAVEGYMEQRK